MRVKLYRAAGMSAAMALVRRELGPDALILGTRRVGDGVEVTAAVEPDDSGSTASAPQRANQPGAGDQLGVAGAHEPELFDDEPPAPAPEARRPAPTIATPMRPDRTREAAPDWAVRLVRQATEDARIDAARAGPVERAMPGLAPNQPPEGGRHAAVLRQSWRGVGAAPHRAVDDATPKLRGREPDEHPADPARPSSRVGASATRGRQDSDAFQDSAATSSGPRDDAGPRRAALAWHGVPPAIAARLTAGPLAFAASIALPFAPLDLTPGAPPVLLAGPPGAGKTLTVARLAARLVLAGTRPLVITADGRRAGATEQLAAFTRLLGLNLLVASTPAALGRALARRDGNAPVLIDAPGVDPFVSAQMQDVFALVAHARAVAALVCPAGLDPNEAADIAAIHRAHGATMMIANRLDVGRRLGGLLAAAAAGLAFAEAGIGPGVADGLVVLTPELLATRLMMTGGSPGTARLPTMDKRP